MNRRAIAVDAILILIIMVIMIVVGALLVLSMRGGVSEGASVGTALFGAI